MKAATALKIHCKDMKLLLEFFYV